MLKNINKRLKNCKNVKKQMKNSFKYKLPTGKGALL